MKSKLKKSVRLSNHVAPKRYSITLFPNLNEFTFTGEEEILLTLTKSTKEITLHAAELEIASATLNQGSSELISQKISYDEKQETATISFEKTIQVSKAWLKLKFSGILNDKMRGFYKSKYEVEGKTHHMAVTQFESTDARRAFPSFDEPAKKAVFDVKLVIPNDHTAISNTIETEIAEHSSGYKIVTFAPTPKMSTYLLAFIVGRFEHIETITKRGLKVRVFTTHGKKHQAEFALDTAKKCMEFYEDYFGISYPLPVIDLIAIPDFASGAMENWGAVTYRESALLVDIEHSSTKDKQWVALVIAHELAHMWFGNLVTMEWWTHLWLNEGFASYIEYLAINEIFPQWDIWTQFVYLEQGTALKLDGLKNTHPIEIEVHHPSEISEIFDKVSYSKGASIIRMLSEYLGSKTFQKGLSHYLKKHQYGNAVTEDLWIALQEVSKKPVGAIMKDWTGKAGYPVITVLEKKNKLLLTQKRYFSSPVVAGKNQDSTLWSIPLFVKSAKGRQISYLMQKKSMTIPKLGDNWIKLNWQERSFIRVDYSSKFLHRFKVPIEKKKLQAPDRLGIIRDAFDLSFAGLVPIQYVLGLTMDYATETNYIVWAEIISQLSKLELLLFGQPFFEYHQTYGRSVLAKIAKQVGWEKKSGESHIDGLLRSLVLYRMGSFNDKLTIDKAQKLFESKTENLNPDLRSVVYNLVAENGSEEEHNIFIDRYKKATLQQEKDKIGLALSLFHEIDLLSKTLAFALSEHVRFQSTIAIISCVWANPYGCNLAWDFIKKNWSTFLERFKGGHLLSRLLDTAGVFTTKEKAKDIKEFFNKNPTPEASRTIAQALERIDANAAWLLKEKKVVKTFLQRFV